MPKTCSRNGFNEFPPRSNSDANPVNVGIYRRLRGDLTQFLHNSERHFSVGPSGPSACLARSEKVVSADPVIRSTHQVHGSRNDLAFGATWLQARANHLKRQVAVGVVRVDVARVC